MLRNAGIELLLQALLSFLPFTKLCIYYSTEASNYDIVQIQLFFVFSPFSFGSPFVGEVFAPHLCQHECWKSRTGAMYINVKCTMIFFYVHALCTPNSKQPNSLEIASILRWVHLLLLLLACAFSTGTMAWWNAWWNWYMNMCYIFMKRKMSWLIVVTSLSKEYHSFLFGILIHHCYLVAIVSFFFTSFFYACNFI